MAFKSSWRMSHTQERSLTFENIRRSSIVKPPEPVAPVPPGVLGFRLKMLKPFPPFARALKKASTCIQGRGGSVLVPPHFTAQGRWDSNHEPESGPRGPVDHPDGLLVRPHTRLLEVHKTERGNQNQRSAPISIAYYLRYLSSISHYHVLPPWPLATPDSHWKSHSQINQLQQQYSFKAKTYTPTTG